MVSHDEQYSIIDLRMLTSKPSAALRDFVPVESDVVWSKSIVINMLRRRLGHQGRLLSELIKGHTKLWSEHLQSHVRSIGS